MQVYFKYLMNSKFYFKIMDREVNTIEAISRHDWFLVGEFLPFLMLLFSLFVGG